MKILTKSDSKRIAAALLQMQDALDRESTVNIIYDVMVSAMRDIAKTAGPQAEYEFALGVTNRLLGK